MSGMSPPNQHVTIIQHVRREALLRILDADRLHLQVLDCPKVGGDLIAQEICVSLDLLGLLLIPNNDSNGSRERTESGQQEHRNNMAHDGMEPSLIGKGNGKDTLHSNLLGNSIALTCVPSGLFPGFLKGSDLATHRPWPGFCRCLHRQGVPGEWSPHSRGGQLPPPKLCHHKSPARSCFCLW